MLWKTVLFSVVVFLGGDFTCRFLYYFQTKPWLVVLFLYKTCFNFLISSRHTVLSDNVIFRAFDCTLCCRAVAEAFFEDL